MRDLGYIEGQKVTIKLGWMELAIETSLRSFTKAV